MITETVARKVLEVIDTGLVQGAGEPVPGKMCVEAAVTFALGEKFSDEPSCVAPALRSLKIRLNDSAWSSPEARAKGLRRLGLAQLGSKGELDEKEFAKRCATLAIQFCAPFALRAVAKRKPDHAEKLLASADACEKEPIRENALAAKYVAYADATASAAYAAVSAAADAAYAAVSAAYAADAAYAAAYAADAAYAAAYAANAEAAADARDAFLSEFAERVVQILTDMKAPGCQWLYLTED